jgi:hypothetical protein
LEKSIFKHQNSPLFQKYFSPTFFTPNEMEKISLEFSQPHFEASVRMKLTLPKVGTWSPRGVPKTQSLIARIKTPHIEVLFIPLERSWSVDVWNGLAWAIWTSEAQVMVERKAGSQTAIWSVDVQNGLAWAIWTSEAQVMVERRTTKSHELTRSWCLQVECDTLFESSWGELQVCFRPHHDQRFELGLMSSQSLKSLN